METEINKLSVHGEKRSPTVVVLRGRYLLGTLQISSTEYCATRSHPEVELGYDWESSNYF